MADRLADLRARFNDDVLPTKELYELTNLLQARVEELESEEKCAQLSSREKNKTIDGVHDERERLQARVEELERRGDDLQAIGFNAALDRAAEALEKRAESYARVSKTVSLAQQEMAKIRIEELVSAAAAILALKENPDG